MCLLLLMIAAGSCAVSDHTASLQPEDKLFVSRKYVGQYVSSSTERLGFGMPRVTYVQTDSKEYDSIVIYGKDCKFVQGERLYIRCRWVQPSAAGYWAYELEGEAAQYRLGQFGYGAKLLTQSWY